jgi:hypothetical protein
VKGHLWMIREFGLRRWLRYQRSRRSGLIIDYGKILTADERAAVPSVSSMSSVGTPSSRRSATSRRRTTT